jgi:hypothetical protein
LNQIFSKFYPNFTATIARIKLTVRKNVDKKIFYNIRKLVVAEITKIPLLKKLPLGKSKGICGQKKL